MPNVFFSILLLPLIALLSGCSSIVLKPAGDIAVQQKDLLLLSTGLMLLIIIPVIALTLWFAWHYRQGNENAEYDPEWDHSTKLELVIWSAPLLIIICLGAITWMGTHLLDPYRTLNRLDAGKSVPADAKPLEIDVVALDWKWLFIYPEYDIATVNEMAVPTDRPVNFRITSSSVMNAFYIPAMAGMIYAMPGMETKLHAVMNHEGTYEGLSANYSGAGFSHMRFAVHSTSEDGFNQWIAKVKSGTANLDRSTYLQLEQPSEKNPVTYYGKVEDNLYAYILNMCVEPGKMCMGAMMAIDAKGGLGVEGIQNVAPLSYDKFARRGTLSAIGTDKTFVNSLCGPNDPVPHAKGFSIQQPKDLSPLRGAGLPQPTAFSLFTPVSAAPEASVTTPVDASATTPVSATAAM